MTATSKTKSDRIFFSVLFIIAFNFFYDRIGFIDLAGDERGIIPLLAPEFQAHVPRLTASFALDALVKLVAFFQGRWNKVTRLAQLATGAFGLYVMYRIFTSDIITVVPFFTTMAKIGILVVMIIEAVELMKIMIRLLIGRPLYTKGFSNHGWFRWG